jgi:hypothetical protein
MYCLFMKNKKLILKEADQAREFGRIAFKKGLPENPLTDQIFMVSMSHPIRKAIKLCHISNWYIGYKSEQLSGLKTGASRDPFGIVASSPPIRVSTSLRPLRYSTLLSSDLLSARTFPCSPGDVILSRFYRGTDCFPSNRISHFQRSIFRMPHRERERKPKGLLILDSALKNGVCG